LRDMSEELIEIIEAQHDGSDDHIFKVTRKTLRNMFRTETGKTPPIEIHISRI